MNIKDFATGVDIENIKRFEKYSKDKECTFVKRIYTEQEIDYCFSHKFPAEHLAVRFSAKEAVYKALSSLNISDIDFADIEISNTDSGVPNIRLLNNKHSDLEFRLSLSHGNGNSLASVVIIRYSE